MRKALFIIWIPFALLAAFFVSVTMWIGDHIDTVKKISVFLIVTMATFTLTTCISAQHVQDGTEILTKK